MEPVCVFDLGGTNFRAATLTADARLSRIECWPAISYVRTAETPDRLQEMCAGFLCDVARRRLADDGCRRAAVSFGGAVDARTGVVLDAAPIWGPGAQPFDLLAALRAGEPRVSWSLVNDVTANVLAYGDARRHLDRMRICVVVVGTGVALRVYDCRTGQVPVGRRHGLQGEIGHLVHATEAETVTCDCGGRNHIGAIASGRALSRRLATPVITAEERRFLLSGEASSMALLRETAAPIAQAVRWLLTLDPEVEEIILTGGVANGLGETYRQALLAELATEGLYQVTNRLPGFFEGIVTVGELGDAAGLIGAGLWALRDLERIEGQVNRGIPVTWEL